MVECYSGLYEDGEVEHINGLPPTLTDIESRIVVGNRVGNHTFLGHYQRPKCEHASFAFIWETAPPLDGPCTENTTN